VKPITSISQGKYEGVGKLVSNFMDLRLFKIKKKPHLFHFFIPFNLSDFSRVLPSQHFKSKH